MDPTYWAAHASLGRRMLSVYGLGPFGLGPAPRPLALATNNVRPSVDTSTPVGYHPVGMLPATTSRRPLVLPARRMTSTASAPAFATYKTSAAGDRARALGLLPTGAPRYGARSMVRLTVSVDRSMTEVWSLSVSAA